MHRSHKKREEQKKTITALQRGEEGLRGRAHCVIALFIYAWTIQMYPVSLSLSLSLAFPVVIPCRFSPFLTNLKQIAASLGNKMEKWESF